LTLWVWNDRFDRGGSRCFAGGFACGLFLEVYEARGARPRSAFVAGPELT